MFWTYIIKSEKTNRYYIGSCGNIETRLKDHNGNRVISTKNKGPNKLIHKEGFEFKKDALKREKQIKSYKSGRAFKKLLNSASPSSPATAINGTGRDPAPSLKRGLAG